MTGEIIGAQMRAKKHCKRKILFDFLQKLTFLLVTKVFIVDTIGKLQFWLQSSDINF